MVWFLLILLGTIWGSSYLFIKVGGAEIPPVTFVAGRTTLAALTLLVALLFSRQRLPPLRSRTWAWLIVLGFLNSIIPYILITWGELHISSGLAAILVGTMPLFTVLLAHWLTDDERMTTYKVAGVLVGFAGVVILFLPELSKGIQLSFWGEFAVVAATLSYALAGIIAHRQIHGLPTLVAPFGQLLSASLVLIPLSLLLDRPWQLTPSLPALGSLAALAVMGTALAYVLYYWLIVHAGATRTSLVTYISPPSALILGALVLGEHLDWTTLLGLAAVIAGVALVSRPAAAPPVLAPAQAE